MKLKNKKIIVTGGASGMGKAAAELFCHEGAQVAILDINKIEGEKTVETNEFETTEKFKHSFLQCGADTAGESDECGGLCRSSLSHS